MRLPMLLLAALVLMACTHDTPSGVAAPATSSALEAAPATEPAVLEVAADTTDHDLDEGTALMTPGPDSPFTDISSFWAGFQQALRDGDVEAALAHFDYPVMVDGQATFHDDLTQSHYFTEMVRPGSPLQQAVLDMPIGDLDGERGLYDAYVGWEVEYDDFVDESGLVLKIGMLQGTYRITHLMGVG